MNRSVTAADANRQFSRLLQEVKKGRSFVVTSHGEPVARLSPAKEPEERAAARKLLFARLRRQRGPRNISRWTRDELYRELL